jgi:hypothetical protein
VNGSLISWSSAIALGMAIIAGVYGYGQLAQRVTNLEELKPLTLAADIAVIKATQLRAIADLAQMRMDVSAVREGLSRRDRP